MNPVPLFDAPDSMVLPKAPSWGAPAHRDGVEDLSFKAGAVLSQLDTILKRNDVPQALLRERLAILAAEACVKFIGRPERVADLRDELCLLRPGDQPGPGGQIYQSWIRAVERAVSVASLSRALPSHSAEQIAEWLDAGQGGPVSGAARVLQQVLTDAPRAETSALILADASLARALGWKILVPLFAQGLRRADLRLRDDALHLACLRAVTVSAIEGVRLAQDLHTRAARLQAIAPKLRAKGAGAAVEIFLRQDAVAPASLPLPGRSARRLCDRLVSLGVACELTGRDTYRLYGV